MNRLVSTKILLIMAIWFLSGGLAFADSFDLTDEFQGALLDRAQALEPDLDEVRETVEEGMVPVAHFFMIASPGPSYQLIHVCDIPLQAAKWPLQETLQTFRI